MTDAELYERVLKAVVRSGLANKMLGQIYINSELEDSDLWDDVPETADAAEDAAREKVNKRVRKQLAKIRKKFK